MGKVEQVSIGIVIAVGYLIILLLLNSCNNNIVPYNRRSSHSGT